MDVFTDLKEELLQIASRFIAVFEKTEAATGVSETNFNTWKKICETVSRRLPDELMRVAIVGPIKSGKSTFANTIFHGDYLKRGAGVVTSIVTRIRKGPRLKATLFFKTWDEINQEMDQAIAFYPSLREKVDSEMFDIRRTTDRQQLTQALQNLDADQLISEGTRNVHSVILSSYLKGYDTVADIVSPDGTRQVYTGEQFDQHRAFSGDEVLAVYLKDIELEINTGGLADTIEIADCQGSDSSNPLHLAMIQDYLLRTNMLVYVISSRTGLRQADIRFLTMIRQMGIMGNTIFVVNCDLSEHENTAGLTALVDRIREEVSLLKPDPNLFAFSSLFNLFRIQEKNGELGDRDAKRLAHWREESDLVAFVEKEYGRFETHFHHKVISERYELLLGNHLKRLQVIASGVLQWARLNQEIIESDEKSAGLIVRDIEKNQAKMNRIKSIIRSTLSGCVNQAKNEMRRDIDLFFEERAGAIVPDIMAFIKTYRISFEQYEESLQEKGFTETLHTIYQEFKRALDNRMAEQANPRIVGFIKQEEQKIMQIFEAIAQPFDSMVADALSGYEKTLAHYAIDVITQTADQPESPDIEAVKRISALGIPTLFAVMRYSARVKTEAMIRLGFYKLLTVFKKVFKKSVQARKDDSFQALKDGIRQMKRETVATLLFHFKNYRENIKFQYLFKLIEAVSAHTYEILLGRFQAYDTNLVELAGQIDGKRIDKERVFAILKETETVSSRLDQRIQRVSEALQQVSKAG